MTDAYSFLPSFLTYLLTRTTRVVRSVNVVAVSVEDLARTVVSVV